MQIENPLGFNDNPLKGNDTFNDTENVNKNCIECREAGNQPCLRLNLNLWDNLIFSKLIENNRFAKPQIKYFRMMSFTIGRFLLFLGSRGSPKKTGWSEYMSFSSRRLPKSFSV